MQSRSVSCRKCISIVCILNKTNLCKQLWSISSSAWRTMPKMPQKLPSDVMAVAIPHGCVSRVFSRAARHFLLQPATPAQPCNAAPTHNHLHKKQKLKTKIGSAALCMAVLQRRCRCNMQRRGHLPWQPQPPHLCPAYYMPSPARARSTSAAINRARATAFVTSQSNNVIGRGELTATTIERNSGV